MKSDRPLYIVTWRCTKTCTSSCLHCIFASNTNTEGEVNTKDSMHIVEEVYNFGASWFGITGGEPLLRKDIGAIIGYARKIGLNVSLITNGYFVEGEIFNTLVRNEVHVSISIDGTRDINDAIRGKEAYETAVSAIRKLSKAGLLDCLVTTLVNVNANLTNVNLKDIEHIIDLAAKHGARWVVFHPFIPFCNSKDHLNLAPSPEQYEWAWNRIFELRQKSQGDPEINVYCPFFARIAKEQGLHDFEDWFDNIFLGKCSFAGRHIHIIENGDVIPCTFNDRYRLGNIVDKTLKEIWGELQTTEFYLRLRNKKNLKGKCGICEYQKICGGCRTRAEMYTCNISESDPACAYIPKCIGAT